MPGPAKPLRVYSRRLRKIDGRSRAAQVLYKVRADLEKHLGHAPSTTEAMIIERCAMLQLKLTLLDEKLLAGQDSEYDSKTYLAWTNSLQRALRSLGLEPPKPIGPSFAEIIAQHDRETAA